MSNVELLSPLTLDECEARLRSATDREGILPWRGSRPVVGRVSGGSVKLRKRIAYRNSLQTRLTGRLERRGSATVFVGQTGLHPLVIVFLAVWFGWLLVFGGIAVIGHPGGQGQLIMCASLLVMMGFGVCLIWFCNWLARDEGAFLIAFVTEVISANPVTSTERFSRLGDYDGTEAGSTSA